MGRTMSQKTGKQPSTLFNFWLTFEDYERLRTLAERERTTMSALLRESLESLFARRERENG